MPPPQESGQPSATYMDELACIIADAFHRALLQKLRCDSTVNAKKGGLENPLCNAVLLSQQWKTVATWRWKKPRHINIQGSQVVEGLMKRLALTEPKSRHVDALDSNVGLCSLVKGRSSSRGLQLTLCRIPLPSLQHFAPTRWNLADHPSRDTDIPSPLPSGVRADASLSELLDFAQGESLRRPFANWIRLFTRLLPAPYGWQSSSESWRFIQHKLKHFPFWYTLRRVSKPHTLMDLDSSLGFPGEGPSVFCPFRLSISLCRWLTWTLPASLPLSFRAFLDFALSCPSLPINFQPNLHVLVSAELHHVFCWNCLKEDQCLAKPRNRETDCWMVVFKNGWKRWVFAARNSFCS